MDFLIHYFDDIPKQIRKVALILFIIIAVLGLGFLRPMLDISAGALVLYLIVYIFLDTVTIVGVLLLWRLMMRLTRKSNTQLMQNTYNRSGFSKELADIYQKGMMYPTDRERAMAAFLMTMAEGYQEADDIRRQLMPDNMSGREKAIYHTGLMLGYAMTGREEKLRVLFSKCADAQFGTYELLPEPYDAAIPYADDALAFYMLAAAIYEKAGNSARREECTKLALCRIAFRSEAENAYLPEVMNLNLLYAQKKPDEAYELEYRLRASAETEFMQEGVRANILKLIAQARIYGSFNVGQQDVSLRDFSQNALIDPSLERPLPDSTAAQNQENGAAVSLPELF